MRVASNRSRNVEDLLTLKSRQFEPGFQWVARTDDGCYFLQRMWFEGARNRLLSHDSRRLVRQALTGFTRLAQDLENGIGDQQLMLRIADLASRHGTLYGDVPKPGALAEGTLDNWKVELLRFLDIWELAQGLLKPGQRRLSSSRIVLREPGDAGGPQRFVFLPRTADLDGEIQISSSMEKWSVGEGPAAVDMPIHARMLQGNDRSRRWTTFTTLVNRRMLRQLNLALHPFETAAGSIGIAPAGLLATAIARLWLNVVTDREDSTAQPQRTCAVCGGPLTQDAKTSATTRRMFCGDRCRQAHRRRLTRV